ncbi:MAG: hypothetical protein ACQETJ_14885 [Bacteroidota bacterium]
MNYLKEEIPDSQSPDEEQELYGFYIYGGKYFTNEYKSKRMIKIELSNFCGESLFHLVNGTNNSKRIIKIQRNTGEKHIIEVQSSEMKMETFKVILKSKQCSFLGKINDLERIFVRWMDNEIQASIIETLGWNPEHQVYAFANAVFTGKNKTLEVNEVGIIDDPDDEKKKYYLPAFGMAQMNNQDYEGERKFIYIEGDLNFQQYSKLYFEAFETNGGIAVLFLILSVFWDIVSDLVGFFPFMFLFGAYGTGKTALVEKLLRVFGKDFKGIPLNNATQVALSRTIASRNNSIFYLKEYTKETDEINQNLFLTAYDGSGRATGVKSNDNRTKVAMVKSAMVLDGNELPTQKTAVLSRMILLNFEKNQFSTEQDNAFKKLEKIQDNGFGKVLTDILQHREYFRENFKKTFDLNMQELRETILADFAERTVKHVALLLVPARLLINKLQFPFSFDKITAAVVDNATEQNRLLKQTDEITIFWTAFAWGVTHENLTEYKDDLMNKKRSQFRIKWDESNEPILQIKLSGIFPEYVKYCKNNGERYLDNNSLKMLLTSKSYEPFIPSKQKKRGNAYTDFNFGSCYQFRLQSSDNGYSINEVEINM